MAAAKHNFVLSRALMPNASALRKLFSQAGLLFLLVFCDFHAVSAANIPKVSGDSVRSGQAFAIADFDGDSRPDLADIQVRESNVRNSVYSIDLQLSAAGRQSIQVVAPPGGLRVLAKDVNGDDAVDLVISTAWSNQPVAIYLNDGHGGFTQAAPASFPDAFRQFKKHWSCASHLSPSVFAVLSEFRVGICAGDAGLLDFRSHADSLAIYPARFAPAPALLSIHGRAPPSASSLP
jgi:hypothetical protein